MHPSAAEGTRHSEPTAVDHTPEPQPQRSSSADDVVGAVELDGARPPSADRRAITSMVPGATTMLYAGLAGALIRVPLIFGSNGFLNSDEAFTGLIAREISDGRLYWIFPGQSYQGTLEAFAVAAVTPVFGVSAVLLKVVSATFWLVAAILLELAARRINSSRPGVVFSLVWLWSSSMALLSSMSLVGYGAGLLCCSLGYWAWSRGGSGRGDWRWMAAAGLGFGTAVWQQPTFLPTAVTFGIGSLLVPTFRNVRSIGALGGGMIVGAGPLIAFNAANDWTGLNPPPQPNFTFVDRLRLTVTELLPRSLGVRLRNGDWTLGRGLAVVTMAALLGACIWASAISWRRYPMARPVIVLALVNVPAIAAFSTSWYTVDARYAISFVPVLAITFGAAITEAARRTTWPVVVPALSGLAVIGLLVPLYREGSFVTTTPNADVDVIVDEVRAMGFRCAIGDYWSTHRIDYLADGRFHASAAPPYPVRLPHLYEEIVSERGRFVRMAPIGSALDQEYAAEIGDSWRRVEIAGTAVFVPLSPARETPGEMC